jgi:hypothetical protein
LAAFGFFQEFCALMPLSACLDDERPQVMCRAAMPDTGGVERVAEVRAVALHNFHRLRMRHFISPVMAGNAMSLMLTLFISECQNMAAGEQSIVLANQIAPLEGTALIDTLVQAGLVVATGKMPGRRTVGLSPLGSARMRAYIMDSLDL